MSRVRESLKMILFGGILGFFVSAQLLILNYGQEEEVHKYKVVSPQYNINQKQAIKRSTASAVRILSMDSNIMAISSLSGTYITYRGNYFILTSAHGIVGDCSSIMVMHVDDMTSCEKMVALDREKDYAIFKVPEMKSRKALRIPQALARWKKSYNLLDETYYTGYPNSIGPTTWTGTIAGFTGDYLILQSYAWSGSSGSGVFDERGELIGVIMALDVGQSEYGIDVLENFVIVVPVWSIDFAAVLME